jgi:L-asparaginase II
MSVELVHVYRGNMVESIHRGDVVIINSEGDILKKLGDPYKKTYWRSAAKPFQVLPFIEAGGVEYYNIEEYEIALMCASHGGEERHIEAVRKLLKKIGLDESVLDCGQSRPMYEGAYRELLRNNSPFLSVHNPCSGKHSAMLALARLKGIDYTDYIQVNHPLQLLIKQTVAQIAQMSVDNIMVAIDGCGVPVFGLPIYNMAVAYSELALPKRHPELSRITSAMTTYPYYVAGTSRLDTIIMEETKGRLVAKLGAESVYCIGLVGEGRAMVLKMEDGNYRALNPVVPEVLERYGFITKDERLAIDQRLPLSITNHRKEVIGRYETVF